MVNVWRLDGGEGEGNGDGSSFLVVGLLPWEEEEEEEWDEEDNGMF